MKVIIDKQSGCCNGVRIAIEKAEEYLLHNSSLYSLGSIVHNDAEINRLGGKGLVTIGYKEFHNLRNSTILIRAHGEPPSTYAIARENNIKIIDCTCPVVLALQKKIASTYSSLRETNGTVIIFGKSGHAEVNGLVGQTEGNAIVIKDLDELRQMIECGRIDITKPLALFSQTTKDPEEYAGICNYVSETFTNDDIRIHDTICKLVSSRHKALENLARECSVIIFVCGKESSNGKVLFDLCRKFNSRSFKIENAEELENSMFRKDDLVGICGATSTTRWQLEKVAAYIENSITPSL